MLCFINIWPLPLSKNELERRQKKFVGNISACSSNNMGGKSVATSQAFRSSGKKQPANISDFCRTGEARIHLGITSSAIFTFEETIICLRHLNQIWFTCNHARAFERNHIFMRWQISDIMWAFTDNIK